jgi:hypothetical protein
VTLWFTGMGAWQRIKEFFREMLLRLTSMRD